MIIALLVLSVAFFAFWLLFFRFKLIELTPGWVIVFGFFVVHLMLVFLIGLRFVTPYYDQCDGRSAHHSAHPAIA